jgi:hypothetical protein
MKQLFTDLSYPFVEILEPIDRWLCINLFYWRLRLWWQNLFSRQELWCTKYGEDASVYSDPTVIQKLSGKALDLYWIKHNFHRMRAFGRANAHIP